MTGTGREATVKQWSQFAPLALNNAQLPTEPSLPLDPASWPRHASLSFTYYPVLDTAPVEVTGIGHRAIVGAKCRRAQCL